MNIRWISGSLLDVPTMGIGPFDYINCTGVLHHLENPTAGLMALKSVLKADGAMGLMVYGKYGRASYYHVQEMMRLINEPEEHPEQKIENTKAAMRSLPETFFSGHGIHRQRHLDGFFNDHITSLRHVFTFPRPSYTVGELYDWLDSCGLEMNGFTNFNASMDEKIQYRPELYIKDENLLDKVMNFPLPKRQAVAELVSSSNWPPHLLLLVSVRCASWSQVIFRWFRFSVIVIAAASLFSRRLTPSRPVSGWRQTRVSEFVLRHPMGLTLAIPNTFCESRIIRYLDGERSLNTIYEMVSTDIEGMHGRKPTKTEFLNGFWESITCVRNWNGFDYAMNRSAYPTYREMQSRVTAQYNAQDHVASINCQFPKGLIGFWIEAVDSGPCSSAAADQARLSMRSPQATTTNSSAPLSIPSFSITL